MSTMKKQAKIYIATLIVVALLAGGTIWAFASEGVSKRKAAADAGKSLKENYQTAENVVVAKINGEPIYQHEVNLKKLINQISYDNLKDDPAYKDERLAASLAIKTEEEILTEIAQFRVVKKEAEKVGISVTQEEVVARQRESIKKLKQLVTMDYGDAKEKYEINQKFLEGLGVTEEEYINGIGAQIEIETMIKTQYITWFYQEEAKKREQNPNYKTVSYIDYLDRLLDNSNLEILLKE